jgi:hypothetical protein
MPRMGYVLVPKLRTRRRALLRSAVYNTRLYPKIVDGIPSVLTGKEKMAFAAGMVRLIAPIDPVGRMDRDSLERWREAMS